jgi:dienelactone hydrolase
MNVIRYFVPFLFNNRVAIVQPRVKAFFTALRASTTLPIGSSGFCWGGFYTFQLTHKAMFLGEGGKPLIDVGYTAHPSNLTLPKDAVDVELPLSVAIGTDDLALRIDKVKEMQKLFEGKKDVEVVLYDDAKHGKCTLVFAYLGDLNSISLALGC